MFDVDNIKQIFPSWMKNLCSTLFDCFFTFPSSNINAFTWIELSVALHFWKKDNFLSPYSSVYIPFSHGWTEAGESCSTAVQKPAERVHLSLQEESTCRVYLLLQLQ